MIEDLDNIEFITKGHGQKAFVTDLDDKEEAAAAQPARRRSRRSAAMAVRKPHTLSCRATIAEYGRKRNASVGSDRRKGKKGNDRVSHRRRYCPSDCGNRGYGRRIRLVRRRRETDCGA